MPNISCIPFDSSIISLSVERDAKRSSGIHLSTIIRDRLITAGIERLIAQKSTEEDGNRLHTEKGFLWERMINEYINTPEWQRIEWDYFATKHIGQAVDDIVALSEGHIIRPGEQLMDGVYMTPDAINVRLHHCEEWKATAIRAKNLSKDTMASKKPGWLWQAAAYARKFGMTRAVIRVWYVADMPPVCNQFIIDWSKEEIEENWKALLQHYQYMRSKGRG